MAYVVAEPCIRCKNTECVSVCPVNCFYEGATSVVINPDECIDCGECVPACPVGAIYAEDSLPDEWQEYVQLNARYAKEWPNISGRKDPLPDAQRWASVTNKREQFEPRPWQAPPPDLVREFEVPAQEYDLRGSLPKGAEIEREGEWPIPGSASGRATILRVTGETLEAFRFRSVKRDGQYLCVVLDESRELNWFEALFEATTFSSIQSAMEWADAQVGARIFWKREKRSTFQRRAAFVSYMREDSALVEEMVEALREAGIETWIDRDSIEPGTLWKESIAEALGRGSIFLACCSNHFHEKAGSYMHDEVEVALTLAARMKNSSWFIPIMLTPGAAPSRLMSSGVKVMDFQAIEYRGPATWIELRRRIGGLSVVLGDGAFEDRLSRAAQMWHGDARTDGYLLSGVAFLVAQCWLHNRHGSELVTEYVKASRQRMGGSAAWGELLRRRETCTGCGTEFRVENLEICTDCFSFFCGRCDGVPQHGARCRGTLVG
jgi:ferredoxin